MAPCAWKTRNTFPLITFWNRQDVFTDCCTVPSSNITPCHQPALFNERGESESRWDSATDQRQSPSFKGWYALNVGLPLLDGWATQSTTPMLMLIASMYSLTHPEWLNTPRARNEQPSSDSRDTAETSKSCCSASQRDPFSRWKYKHKRSDWLVVYTNVHAVHLCASGVFMHVAVSRAGARLVISDEGSRRVTGWRVGALTGWNLGYLTGIFSPASAHSCHRSRAAAAAACH